MLNLKTNQDSFSKQLPKNLIYNIIYFAINLLIGISIVPYYVNKLGVAGYAMIPLATSLTGYVNLVVLSLNTSVSRYLTIELQKEDFKSANIIFNTALFGTSIFTLLLIPVIIVLSLYIPNFFDVPTNLKHETILMFSGVMCSVLVRTLGGNYGVSLFAYNRLDLQNIINVVNIAVQIILIIILFNVFSPNLSYIGFSYMIAALLSLIITIIFSKKINPHLKVNAKGFKPSYFRNLTKTGGWILIDQLGTLLLFQIDIIVVNKIFGPAMGGEYSIMSVWSTLITAIAGVLASVLTPVIFTYYAKKMYGEILLISRSAVKFMGLALALPIGLICGFAPQILSLWVGPEYSKLSPLMWIIIGHLAVNMSVLPLFPINVAFDKVRVPALITVLMGVGNLLLAIVLSSITGWGYYGVAIAGAIMLTTRHLIFVPYYTTKILNIATNTYSNSILLGALSTFIIAIVAKILSCYLNASSLTWVIIPCIIISVSYFLCIWRIGLTKYEHKMIESFILSMKEKTLKLKPDLTNSAN